MRSISCITAAAALLLACNQGGGAMMGAKAEPKTDEDKTFYALGLFEAQRVAAFNMSPAELQMMESGLADALNGTKPKVELQQYQPKLQALFDARRKAVASKAKEKGKAFLDEAAKAPGAQKTPSGLVYTILKEGTGAMPAASDSVKVNYEGKLTDGTVFDSSYQRGQPAEFPLAGVIRCWTEGVQKIKVGGKAKLVCPSDIAYGENGSPPKIPGGSTLVFEVELIDITTKKAPAMPAMPPSHPMPGATPAPAK